MNADPQEMVALLQYVSSLLRLQLPERVSETGAPDDEDGSDRVKHDQSVCVEASTMRPTTTRQLQPR